MEIKYAMATTHVSAGTGHTVLVVLGTHWPADDPIVQTFPELFTDNPMYGLVFTQPPVTSAPEPTPERVLRPSVESATAAPGERRAAIRRDVSKGDV